MANELSMTAQLGFNKVGVTNGAVTFSINGQQYTVNGSAFVKGTMNVPITTPGVLPLGGVTTPGWAAFLNLDPTNYVLISNGLSGAALVQLLAGEFAMFRIYGSAIPYLVANTAPCLVDYVVIAN